MVKKDAKEKIQNSDKADFGSRITNGLANFKSDLLNIFIPNTKEYLLVHWIKIIVLVASATQTYALIKFFAPAWAWWLPIIAVLLTEGATPFWQWRESEADAADGSVDDKEKNKQERIANGMVWTGLVAVCSTMVAGALIEVSNSEQLSAILKPNESVTGALGWIAIIGVFLFGAIQMWADWQYKRADPMLMIQRENRATMRTLDRRRMQAIYRGEEHTTKIEARTISRNYRTLGKKIGTKRGEESFENATGMNDQINKKGKNEKKRKHDPNDINGHHNDVR